MEISNLRILGENNAVVYTGKYFIVHNNFVGLLAIAERDKDNDKHFVISVGNSHCTGGGYTNNVLFNNVKAFIQKKVSKYVACTCTFEMQTKDLNKCYLDIQIKNY